MILFKRGIDLRNYLDIQYKNGIKIGFIPTMGALHAGHISLILEARKKQELTIASIFINPTQFNDPTDYQKYPVTLEKDIQMLEETGCDILFLPSVEEIYPGGIHNNTRHYDLGYIETILEGKYRPGHFQGVCQVVHRLLEIVIPHQLYLGQKDYQQCLVIRKLLTLIGMDEKTEVNISPTLRENDGLAMSSRNIRLNPADRKKATVIYKALNNIKRELRQGGLISIKQQATEFLQKEGFKVDYVEIADAANLEPLDYWDGKRKIVALIAAFISDVRLIDNISIDFRF